MLGCENFGFFNIRFPLEGVLLVMGTVNEFGFEQSNEIGAIDGVPNRPRFVSLKW